MMPLQLLKSHPGKVAQSVKYVIKYATVTNVHDYVSIGLYGRPLGSNFNPKKTGVSFSYLILKFDQGHWKWCAGVRIDGGYLCNV